MALARKRLVHRDVKPANILLRRPDRSPVLIDFGLAIDLNELTDFAADLSGTPFYMAPEAWRRLAAGPGLGRLCPRRDRGRGARRPTERADRFAIVAASEIVRELRGKVADELASVADADLKNWVARLLAHDPAERHAALEDAQAWPAA